VRRILAQAETAAWLVWPHAFRFVGGVFLIVMAQGHLPAAFALPAGIGDIVTATAAPLVARRAGGRRAALVFNAFGLLDLLWPLRWAPSLVSDRTSPFTSRRRPSRWRFSRFRSSLRVSSLS
jgi:hypothetical protein